MAKYKPNKDKKSHVKKIQETEGSGFGEYKESTGGGKPFEKGNSNTRTTRENGKQREAENPTTNQPRDRGGRFTYKSVNGQSIDPKYGPSRGKTVNPLLTGGDGTIKIEDVGKQFSQQSGSYWDKYKDKWHTSGGKVVTEGLQTKISAEEIWNVAKKRYDSVKGEFEGETENWQTKTGKKSAAEKAAIEKVKATGEQQNPIDVNTGAIENVHMKEKMQEFAKAKKAPVAPKEEVKVEEQKTTEEPPVSQPAVNPEDQKPWGSGKYNVGQKNKAIAAAKKMLGDEYDPEIWEDEGNLEEFIEQYPEVLN